MDRPRPHARRLCIVCGVPLDDQGAHLHARRPWTPGELLAAGWCAGVATLAIAQLLASWWLS
jgi:hypothetical protein